MNIQTPAVKAAPEFCYEIRVNSEVLLTGDELSVSVIYANLVGRNFETKSAAEFFQWLSYMQAQHPLELGMGRGISMRDPDGKALFASTIGQTQMMGWNARGKYEWVQVPDAAGDHEIKLQQIERGGEKLWEVSNGKFVHVNVQTFADFPKAYDEAKALSAFYRDEDAQEASSSQVALEAHAPYMS